MLNINEKLLLNLNLSIKAKNDFIENRESMAQFVKAVELIKKVYDNGGRVYIAGNGGSAADAQHLAAEFVSKLAKLRDPIPAEALTVDSSVITAIANDFGYEEVFSRQLRAKATSKDVFMGLTTSGLSKNIIHAVQVCKELKVKTVIFTGNDGGKCKNIADCCVIVPSTSTCQIQEVHTVLYHTLCEIVETHLFR
jgi:D-sedoheptulose 7-phosphate isomerase